MAKELLALLLTVTSGPVLAGAVVGATEPTQIANNIQLVLAYANQVNQYRTQLQQYQLQLQNLTQNSGGNLSANTSEIIEGVGSIMAAENSIGGTLHQIDDNFAKAYKSPSATTYAERYKGWTNTSMATFESALRAVGLHRDSYATDADALQDLYNRSQSSTGTVAAVQQLSALTAMQIQQTQGLTDLMTTQNEAATTWMASQVSKEQSAIDNDAAIRKGFLDAVPSSIPPLDTSKKTYPKLNLYLPQ